MILPSFIIVSMSVYCDRQKLPFNAQLNHGIIYLCFWWRILTSGVPSEQIQWLTTCTRVILHLLLKGFDTFPCFQKVVKLTRCFQPFNYISRSIFFTLKKIRWSSLSVCSTTLVSHGEMKSCPTKFTSYWITAHVPLHEQSEKMNWTKPPDLFPG